MPSHVTKYDSMKAVVQVIVCSMVLLLHCVSFFHLH